MLSAVMSFIQSVSHLARAPAVAIEKFADDADEIWEPFLSDDPLIWSYAER